MSESRASHLAGEGHRVSLRRPRRDRLATRDRPGRGHHRGTSDHCIDPTGHESQRVAAEQWRQSYARIIIPISATIGTGGILAAIITYYVWWVSR